MADEKLISEALRERAINAAPGPILTEENGIVVFAYAVPQAIQQLQNTLEYRDREIRRLLEENNRLRRGTNY